jgi:hypothetical protein
VQPPRRLVARNVVCALLGALALVLEDSYHGPLAQQVHAYAGNVCVSFAMYFALLCATLTRRHARLLAAALTLAAVTAFELTDGFGLMANVYDPIDVAANGVGVGAAVLVDVLSERAMTRGA